MASSASPSAGHSRPRATSQTTPRSTISDPVLRNTLRYTVSAREYATLHKYVLSRSRVLRKATPSPGSVERALSQPSGGDGVSSTKTGGHDDFNAKAVRHALRVFVATWVGMKGWEAVTKRMSGDKE